MMLKKILFFILFQLCLGYTQAQEPVSVQLTEKDGLPDKEFYNIIEDRNGFIWLAADKGLFRYDGKVFKNYSNREKRGLSVFEPVEDQLGRIWCNNISGQFFYVENDQLITFIDLGKELNGELSNFVVTAENLIVFTKYRIYYVNLLSKKVTTAYETDFVFGMPFEYNNDILFGAFDNLCKLSKGYKKENLFKIELPKPKKNGNFNVSEKSKLFKLGATLFLRREHNEKNRFFKLDLNKNQYTEIHDFEVLSDQRYLSCFENNGQLWVATTNGVLVYSYKNDIFKLEKQFLEPYHITKIIKDKDDNFWFTTLNNGVFVIPNIHIERLNISESNRNISGLEKIDDNTLFFGTKSGDVGFYDIINHTEDIIDLPSTARVSAIKYHAKEQWTFISKDDGGFLLDNNTKQVAAFSNFRAAKSLSIINNENLLFVNYANVRLLDSENFNKEGEDISSNKRTFTSFYDPEYQSTYIGFVDDLVIYDSDWIPNHIRNNDQSIFATTLTKTTNGMIWAATFKDGIYGIAHDKVVSHFSTDNGLVSNRIENIKADDHTLWIATDKGIQLLDVETKKIKTLTKRDGIVSYDISGIEILDNTVVFSSNLGLFRIDKKLVFKAPIQHNVYFSQLEINEEPTDLKSNYDLDYDQNTINIEFNVNGFQFNQKGTYTYRLLGLNTDWVSTETGINSVKYNSLPAGNYTFQVKPVLDFESSDNTIKALKFSIKRPFWKTWWFISGLSILVLGSTVVFYRRKIKQKEQQRQIEIKQLSLDNELINLKLENLRSQMNPHFIFNALNSIQEYIVLNQKILASIYLGKFADLIRTYLNHSTKGRITLQEEIDCLEMYLELEKLRFEDKLEYAINSSGSLTNGEVYIPTMLIQPYVENALKHGLLHRKTDRILKIDFIINDKTKTVKCVIIDNGVGRDKAEAFKARKNKKHKSFATKATQDRLALFNYGKQKQVGVTITDLFEDDQPSGTQVEINIPFTT
ncbi:histidine kinase [Winogradskyella sp. SM1960]|uniref:sensor histidine kinase n=1 Tax=Winogradskyella sp. SM1960 TaxID=2865955 RepID=UPI001CD792E3|nr:histidine kinase [Winogradskyella sp. SM1960]